MSVFHTRASSKTSSIAIGKSVSSNILTISSIFVLISTSLLQRYDATRFVEKLISRQTGWTSNRPHIILGTIKARKKMRVNTNDRLPEAYKLAANLLFFLACLGWTNYFSNNTTPVSRISYKTVSNYVLRNVSQIV